jgi:hypothetical protein
MAVEHDGVREWVFIAVATPDVAAADAAFELLLSHEPEMGSGLDAVTIGRKSTGEVRFDRESGAYGDPGAPAGWSAAAGLAAAVYPSVGADLPASRIAERAVLNAVAGLVADAVGRGGLMEFGEHLDTAPAALIAAAPATACQRLLQILENAGPALARSTAFDVVGVGRSVEAVRTVLGRGGSKDGGTRPGR